MFNIHEIEDDYAVFVAFETMNNRGKKLTNLELLKNCIIYLTTLFSDTKWIIYFQYSRKKGDDYIKFLLNRFKAKSIFEKQVVPIIDDVSFQDNDTDTDDEDVLLFLRLLASQLCASAYI